MSSLLHPSGSQSPQVYWRRRLLVLGAALVALVFLIWLVVPKGTAPEAGPPPVMTSPSASPSPSPSASPSPTATPVCAPSDVGVSLAGYQKLVSGTVQPFKVTVVNNGAQPCAMTISPANLKLTVTSGKDRIWSTEDCAKWVPVKRVALKSKESAVVAITWPGGRSKAGCVNVKAVLGAGTYLGTAQVFGQTDARLPIQLTKA